MFSLLLVLICVGVDGYIFVCAHLVLYSFITPVGLCVRHHSQDAEQLCYHKDPYCPFTVTSTSIFPPQLFLIPGNH